MTPLQITMILHFHYSPLESKHSSHGSNAYGDALWLFEREGLIKSQQEPILTDRGNAYVHFLTTMPLPNANWRLPSWGDVAVPQGNRDAAP